MWFLYILKCDDGSLYTGITQDLKRRFAEHQAGIPHYTSYQNPVEIIYTEAFQTKSLARKRELQIKGWTRAKKIALANRNIELLKCL
ncbi:MAG: hypothetical protein COV74_03605 [Candidatus Omnitrophica bacterium CG11_big_fil_rev_8_21_14_0_20_45_26]|uniref:GIY-YIG domain-containing protein n=1 Tax=Candidatus Abzuiibacterium crystallinum TaxID=1974748 RepID=A0A2H0LQL6_9BACT|nr:MAG: hypothetical protein COV74_03605 [Candidatus Omnitrophica bacterium CG11_big_fil_rev_8_21_14_0_20_45_26]PIW63337.1 MAG: hypothetical protein COW12_10755 [Candidatus Omnitrophica bacterium CG12_big_fil_rev_8_21_14_0_65_45_16]